MICVKCGCEIKRGKRFKSEKYKNENFCSEECYEQFLIEKTFKKTPLDILKRYITSIYPDPLKINWCWLSKQIKSISEEYNLSYIEMGKILKYAVEYEGVVMADGYGLGQVFPRYIEPTMDFIKSIQKSRDMVDEIDDDVVNVVRVSKSKKRMWRERD